MLAVGSSTGEEPIPATGSKNPKSDNEKDESCEMSAVPHGVNPTFVAWVDKAMDESKHLLLEATENIASEVFHFASEQENSTGVLG